MKREIEFCLSEPSLKKLKSELKKINFEKINKAFIKRSMEFISYQIQLNISATTGQGSYELTYRLLNDFGIDKIVYEGSTIGMIVGQCGYSAFVEYGTGVVGLSNPHPNAASDGWSYDVNGHGEKGWYYMKDGKFYLTKGMPAHRFVYNAMQVYLMNYKHLFELSVKEVIG